MRARAVPGRNQAGTPDHTARRFMMMAMSDWHENVRLCMDRVVGGGRSHLLFITLDRGPSVSSPATYFWSSRIMLMALLPSAGRGTPRRRAANFSYSF